MDSQEPSVAKSTSIELPAIPLLSIRTLMQDKEVCLIIANKGELVKKIRAECENTRITVSTGAADKIVTVKGTNSGIEKAFQIICTKFEEMISSSSNTPTGHLTIRLIIPAFQCGSLIGKGGSKIKEIRERTGANITVASELLTNSTERTVTLAGSNESVTQCISNICIVISECSVKGTNIQYRLKPQVNGPVILSGGQAYCIQGNLAVPAHPNMYILGNSPLDVLAALGIGGLGRTSVGAINPAALAAIAGSKLTSTNQNNSTQNQYQELVVPNELLGCIIGKGGSKITEIRQVSGAMIRISNCQERQGGNIDRTVSISGNPDAVSLAHFLINMSIELQKANLEAQKNQAQSQGTGRKPYALDQLFTKILSSLSNIGGSEETTEETTQSGQSYDNNYTPKQRSFPTGPPPDRRFMPY